MMARTDGRENGSIELYNGSLRGELLNCEIFTNTTDVKVLIE
jgi:hypothetical protein